MPKSSLPVLILLVHALTPANAAAQNEYEEQVMLQLELLADVFFEEGYDPIVWEGGALDDDEAELYEVTLEEGYTYALVGVCDEDCSDLDLALFDGDGMFVVEDVEVDDAPVIEFTVTRSGAFTLDVTMFECSSEPCYYGVGLFGW